MASMDASLRALRCSSNGVSLGLVADALADVVAVAEWHKSNADCQTCWTRLCRNGRKTVGRGDSPAAAMASTSSLAVGLRDSRNDR